MKLSKYIKRDQPLKLGTEKVMERYLRLGIFLVPILGTTILEKLQVWSRKIWGLGLLYQDFASIRNIR